jgi:serine phosphatase RsbU (regulator of sigma subunit)
LLSPEPRGNYETQSLITEAPAIGSFEDARYLSSNRPVAAGARLLVFSDGVFELFREVDRVGTWQEFITTFELPEVQRLSPAARLERAQKARGAETLEDDFSLLEVRFP